jgi:hypothetical protein
VKLHTPEGRELMEVVRVEPAEHNLVVRAVVMGNVPTRVVVKPRELRAAFGLLSWKLVFSLLAMLFRKSPSS